MGIMGSFPGNKAVGAWSWPLASIYWQIKNVWSYTSIPPVGFHGGGAQLKHRDNFTLHYTIITKYLPFTSVAKGLGEEG